MQEHAPQPLADHQDRSAAQPAAVLAPIAPATTEERPSEEEPVEEQGRLFAPVQFKLRAEGQGSRPVSVAEPVVQRIQRVPFRVSADGGDMKETAPNAEKNASGAPMPLVGTQVHILQPKGTEQFVQRENHRRSRSSRPSAPAISRSEPETEQLIRDIVNAIAQNEVGGAAQAMESRMGTSSGVAASYASATQMIPSHAIGVLRSHPEFAARFGLTAEALVQARDITRAVQRIWDALVKNAVPIERLNQRDLRLTRFTPEHLNRILLFRAFRNLLLSQQSGFNQLKEQIKMYFRSFATRVLAQMEREIHPPPIGGEATISTEAQIAGTTHSDSASSLVERSLECTPANILRPLNTFLSFSFPAGWARMNTSQKTTWLTRRRRTIERVSQDSNLEPIAKKSAAYGLAHELAAHEHVVALGWEGTRESNVRAYIHNGDFNRFNEDRASWSRVALQQHSLPAGSSSTLDAAISAGASSGGGRDLSRLDFDSWIRRYISRHPAATNEAVVRAAAAHNGHSPQYPGIIWRNYQAILARRAASATAETTETPAQAVAEPTTAR